jgi:hypothetical protein
MSDNGGGAWYTLYLLYWYKSTDTDGETMPDNGGGAWYTLYLLYWYTLYLLYGCLVHTLLALLVERCRTTEGVLGTHFTCFTGTKVQILTVKTLLAEVQANAATVQLQLAELSERVAAAGIHSVPLLFTGTKSAHSDAAVLTDRLRHCCVRICTFVPVKQVKCVLTQQSPHRQAGCTRRVARH